MSDLDQEFTYNTKAVVVNPMSNHITYANKILARNIVAALTLGDVSFLDLADIWVEEMLGHYRLSADLKPCYLQIYHQAAKNHLDERGQLLVEHLAHLSTKTESESTTSD